MAWGDDKWVVVGESTTADNMVYSYDGINWTGLGKPLFADLGRGISYNGAMWVAVGGYNYTIGYSFDGLNWVPVENISTFFRISYRVNWGGDKWIAGGWTGNPIAYITTLAYSYDGINWQVCPNITDIFPGNAVDSEWDGKKWIATGANSSSVNLAVSSDGIIWTPVANSDTPFVSNVMRTIKYASPTIELNSKTNPKNTIEIVNSSVVNNKLTKVEISVPSQKTNSVV